MNTKIRWGVSLYDDDTGRPLSFNCTGNTPAEALAALRTAIEEQRDEAVKTAQVEVNNAALVLATIPLIQ